MRLATTLLALTALLLAVPGAAVADSYEDGQRAFDRGDIGQARMIWREPATKGDARAQFGLGRLLLLLPDMEGLSWIEKSAAAGYLPAEVELALFHLHGLHVPHDLASMVSWLRKATQHDEKDEKAHRVEAARARNLLALAYRLGGGVPVDTAKGNALLRKAADEGHPEAQFTYAEDLEKGTNGVARDLPEAHKYFVLCWKQGNEGASARARALRQKMSPAEFQRSRESVRTWLADRDAGKLGWIFDAHNKRTKGEKALFTLDQIRIKVLRLALLSAHLQNESCNRPWLRSRTIVRGRQPGSTEWVETWTMNSCGRTFSTEVKFKGVGKDLHWTVRLVGPDNP